MCRHLYKARGMVKNQGNMPPPEEHSKPTKLIYINIYKCIKYMQIDIRGEIDNNTIREIQYPIFNNEKSTQTEN